MRGLHRAMRGRYRAALIAAIVGGLAGAGAGYVSVRPVYRSEGVVRVVSAMPAVLEETDQNKLVPMFDSFLQGQQQRIQSREMMELALAEDAWRGVKGIPAGAEDFAARVTVDVRAKTDWIRIGYSNEEPAAAAAGVKSLLRVFERTFEEDRTRLDAERMALLEGRRRTLQQTIDTARAENDKIVDGAGAADLQPLFDAASQKVLKFEAALTDVRKELALSGVAEDEGAREAVRDLTPEQIALSDVNMRRYVDEKWRLEREIERTSIRFGPNHPLLRELRVQTEQNDQQIEEYAREYKSFRSGEQVRADGKKHAGIAGSPREQEQKLKELLAAARHELSEVVERRASLERLTATESEARKQLAEVEKRIQALTTEGAMAHRVLVTNSGELPVVSQDKRSRMAGGGAAAGAFLPVAFLLAVGWCDRRYRRSKELAQDLGEQTPFVAVLPEVNPNDPARASDAVRAVHQLRVLLESGSGVFLVSGGEGGEGKSSVALALGLSYAAAGLRTLVVDADFTSRTLTRNLKLEGAPVDWARMLDGGAVANQARRIWSRLFLLPAGERASSDLSAVSSAGLDGLVDEVRRIADVVLIDTGAGATESALARRADGVLLVVGRGQKHEHLRAAIRRYDLLGVPLAGVVFNRADDSDFYAASGVKPGEPMELLCQPMPEGLEGFGPLAGAVATSLKLKIAKGAAVRPASPEPQEAPRSEAA